MVKLAKWLFFILIALALIIIVAGYIATRSVNPETVKSLVEEQTYRATSLDMNFNGDFYWSFFPSIKLGVSDIELHTRQAYDGDTLFASIGEASSAISLLGLLGGNVTIDSLQLADISMRMVTDARGHSNWKDVEPSGAETSDEDSGAEKREQSASADVSFDTVKLRDINLSVVDLGVGSRQALRVKTLDGRAINFTGQPFDLQSALEVERDTSAEAIAMELASTFRFNSDAQEFIIEKLDGVIADTSFSGSGAVTFGKDTKFAADLALGTLDLNPYLSATANEDDAASTSTTTTPNDDIELPLDTLHTLNVDLALSLEKLIFEQTELEDLSIAMTIDNGLLDVSKLNASVYGGEINQSFSINAARNPAQLQATQALSDIDVASLLASNDFELGVEGKASVETNITARGNSTEALKKTLSGKTTASLNNGRYLNDNIEHRICQSIALARKTPLNRAWASGTDLEDVDLKINWSKGVGNIESFSAGLANAKVNGDGEINLLNTSYDLRLQANVSGDLAAASSTELDAGETGCEINEQYRDIAWPIRCKGDAQESSCGVDNSRLDKILSNLAKAKAKEAVDKELDKHRGKLQDKLNEKLGDGVGDALRGLFR